MSDSNLDDIPKEFKQYIKYIYGLFAVKNNATGVLLTFGRFKSKEFACAATKLLIKYNWKLNVVKNDSVIKYDDEFYVFKVMNNKLIFDTKFDSFEKAVEYFEINLRCNDYHNDIFKTASINNEHKTRLENPNENIDVNINKDYIFEEDDKFILKKSKRKDSHIFGVFNSINEALAARKLLLENNWHISDGAEIVLVDDVYWVFDIDYSFCTVKEILEHMKMRWLLSVLLHQIIKLKILMSSHFLKILIKS